jgi:hypothetical protein
MCPRTVFSDEWVSGDMPLSVYKKISRYFHLVGDIQLGTGSYEKLKKAEKAVERILSEDPLPEVCRTCYKAYNI